MDDDFHDASSNGPSASQPALVSKILGSIIGAPMAVTITILLTPLLIVITTRFLTGHSSQQVSNKNSRTVWMLPYWVPVIGHGFQFYFDPIKLMSLARNQSPHGIFALNLGTSMHNIVSDPTLVKGVMQKKESVLQFNPIAWTVLERFFGIPKTSKPKYEAHWEELTLYHGYLMREPHLSNMLEGTIRILEDNIPQMITFMESEIDQQPWERSAEASYVSESETEINLMSLMRDMMGHASVPGVFGCALMEKYPNLLHDVYDMDAGMYYFLMGFPAWTPWPGMVKAHLARFRIWQALDDHQRALDATVDGKPIDPTWGNFDDVSELIMKRHALFKNNGFEIKERGDLSILWALVANANLLVFWHLLHILATPGLADRVRAEIAPYTQVFKPASIGRISEAPKLRLSYERLSKNCPLFRSTYFEALRISSQPWSVRKVATDTVISGDPHNADPASFILRQGEYVTIPHDLHMRDPKYFKFPDKFDPERFIIQNEDGSISTDLGTTRPYGGGSSMCKGRFFAERECLALVAGLLMFWDIEPADKKVGWIIPKQRKTSAVSLPLHETRVRVKVRQFEWDN